MFGCFIAPTLLTVPLCAALFIRDCYFKNSGQDKKSPSPTKKGSEGEGRGLTPEGVTEEEKIDIELDSFVNREQ